MAIRRKVSHHNEILSKEVRPLSRVSFGDLIEFKYSGEKVYDLKPLVYILEKKGDLVKGINLNYLTEYKIKMLFSKVMERGNVLVEEDQDDGSDFDDTLPYRNLLKDPYTRLRLPTYREDRGGNPLSKAEAVKQMDMLYEKKLKKILKKHDIYRSYFTGKMGVIKVVTYDIEGLLK